MSDVEDKNWYLMLIGKTGHGKSSTGNALLTHDDFLTGDDSISVSDACQLSSTRCDGETLTVVDTPGLCDTRRMPEGEAMQKVVDNLKSSMALCPLGVDCFLFVLSYASCRFTQEEENTVRILQKIFTPRMFEQFCIVLFTHKDVFEARQKKAKQKTTFEEWYLKQNEGLKELLALCQYRCLLFDNMNPSEQQRRDLVRVIKKMKNGQGRYCNQYFEAAATEQKLLVEEAHLPAVTASVMQKLALFREDLQEALASSDPSDDTDLLFKLDEIKDDVEELLFEIKQLEYTSGLLDGITNIINDFLNHITSKAGAKELLNRLNSEDAKLRRALLKGASIASGILTTAGAPSAAIGAGVVASNPITPIVALGVIAGVGIILTGTLGAAYGYEKWKKSRREKARLAAREERQERKKAQECKENVGETEAQTLGTESS